MHNHVFFNARIIVVATVKAHGFVAFGLRSARIRYRTSSMHETIRVEGCVLSILCGGENMTRIK